MKLGGMDGDSVTSWDWATWFSCMKDCIQKFWRSILTHLPCCWGCIARIVFPLGACEWVAVRELTVEKGCETKREEQRECVRNGCCRAVRGGHWGQHSLLRGVSAWHSHWEVWTKCGGACFLPVSHLKRHLLHPFVSQVAILVMKAFACSVNDTISFAMRKFHVRARRERC